MIGIFGGTFDPIHFGHLRPADQVRRAVSLGTVRFLPCARPPHRDPPAVGAEHRLRMVELALEDWPGLVADDREVRMGGVSYTVRTLQSLREEIGDAPLALIVGADAFQGIPSWFSWEDIPRLANIIVMDRPGVALQDAQGAMSWGQGRVCADLERFRQSTAGKIFSVAVAPVDISATRIRAAVARGESIADLVPPAVRAYIEQNNLYRERTAKAGGGVS